VRSAKTAIVIFVQPIWFVRLAEGGVSGELSVRVLSVDSERPAHGARDGKAKARDLGHRVIADEPLVAEDVLCQAGAGIAVGG